MEYQPAIQAVPVMLQDKPEAQCMETLLLMVVIEQQSEVAMGNRISVLHFNI